MKLPVMFPCARMVTLRLTEYGCAASYHRAEQHADRITRPSHVKGRPVADMQARMCVGCEVGASNLERHPDAKDVGWKLVKRGRRGTMEPLIRAYLRRHGRNDVKRIHKAVGSTHSGVSSALQRMFERGEVHRPERGVYALVEQEEA